MKNHYWHDKRYRKALMTHFIRVGICPIVQKKMITKPKQSCHQGLIIILESIFLLQTNQLDSKTTTLS